MEFEFESANPFWCFYKDFLHRTLNLVSLHGARRHVAKLEGQTKNSLN